MKNQSVYTWLSNKSESDDFDCDLNENKITAAVVGSRCIHLWDIL